MVYNSNDKVIITNITSKPELNMKEGKVINYNENNERYSTFFKSFRTFIKKR